MSQSGLGEVGHPMKYSNWETLGVSQSGLWGGTPPDKIQQLGALGSESQWPRGGTPPDKTKQFGAEHCSAICFLTGSTFLANLSLTRSAFGCEIWSTAARATGKAICLKRATFKEWSAHISQELISPVSPLRDRPTLRKPVPLQ